MIPWQVGLGWKQMLGISSWRKKLLPDVLQMVRRGLPGAQIIRQLQRIHGHAYRRQDVYRDVRRFSDAIEREERLRQAEEEEPISIDDHYEVVDKIPTRFSYLVHAWGRDPETGRFKAVTYRMYADRPYSRAALRANVESLLRTGESSRLGRLDIKRFDLLEARVNPEAW